MEDITTNGFVNMENIRVKKMDESLVSHYYYYYCKK